MEKGRELIDRVERAVREVRDHGRLLQAVVRAIHESSDRYDWTGIYLLQGEELVLRTYLGPPSPHERIPIGKGICGAAAREQRTIIVPDVQQDDRYLACSLETRSEMVVPIFRNGQVIGEIDIDSNTPDRFGDCDRQAIETVAGLITARLPGSAGKGEQE
ncbi:MAG: GAF domain-containing protein [Acidobacteriota bacterium]